MEKLQHLLEHVHPSLLSNNTQERARAVQTRAALLQFATSLPGFDVFGELFTEEQKRSFLQAGLLAIHHHLLHVSQAGLVLTYSILGEAGQLLEDEPRSRPSIHPLQLCLLLLLIFPNPSDFDYMASTFAWIWTLARTSDHPASTSGLDMDTDSGSAWTYSAPGSSRQAPPLIKP
ncbi:uncharacterized protein LOC120398053 isoform X2 [Mauremys reevesii]|nr:uncharacterized protein LOC120398053 isoform X2 [Mauremys reevesii]XP_039380939.1 uncharacterized protein LOC120398053 isoform X2 [Mauremys reevesii]